MWKQRLIGLTMAIWLSVLMAVALIGMTDWRTFVNRCAGHPTQPASASSN